MKNATKMLIVLIMLFSFSSIFAGSLTPSTSTPNFFVSVQGAFIRPQTVGTAFTIIDHAPFPEDIEELRGNRPLGPLIHIVAPYKLAGGASIGYLFPSAVDFQVSLFTNNHNRSRTLAKDEFYEVQNAIRSGENFAVEEIFMPLFDTILAHGPVEDADKGKYSSAIYASSRVNYRTSIVNLAFGYWRRHATQHHILWVHPHLGLNISKLYNRQKTQYKGIIATPQGVGSGPFEVEIAGDDMENGLSAASVTQLSETLAMGPLVGIDFYYGIAKPLAIEARAQFGMLIGRVHASHEETYLKAESDDEDFNYSILTSKTDPLIIKYFNAQIGLNYHFTFSHTTTTEISAGYRVTGYSNSNASFSYPNATDPVHAVQLFESSGFHGPFLSITQHMT